MKKWECIVCAWVYDEVLGWPDDGIEPGTKWQDIPDDWLCPDCGVGKEDFDRVEIIDEAVATPNAPHHEQVSPADIAYPVVIIGTGLAGYNLAREFRKYDQGTQLLLITADDGCNYSKPMLSTGFTRKKDAAALAMANAEQMAEQLNARIMTFSQVTAIDTVKQQIMVAEATSVETVQYSKLVLAWGADVIRPPLEGDGHDYIYAVNNLLDYDVFRKAVDKTAAKKILIIGGGLIGSEFTNDLSNSGFSIEVVDPLGYSMPTLLPEEAGKTVQAALESMGAKFHFGRLLSAVNKHPEGGIVGLLDDGQEIRADLLVSAVGVRPRTDIAQDAGIDCNRGIVANRYLETSAENVYTLGDCAEVEGQVLFYVAPLMAATRALAKTLTGLPTKVVYPAMPVMIKTPICPVCVSPPPRDAEGEWSVQVTGDDVVALFKSPDGRLLGFALTGAKGIKEKMRLQKLLPPILA